MYPGAKSTCSCGHTGDGTGSDHAGLIGHGPCNVEGCDCKQFTWIDWLPGFKEYLAELRKEAEVEAK